MEIPLPYLFPVWGLAIVCVVLFLLSLEAGFRLGCVRHRKKPGTDGGDIALTSMFALLGLVLAFTYSFAVGRSDLRKQAVVAEANAVGTAFLRANFGPQPAARELRQVLRDYTETRIVLHEEVGTDERVRKFLDRTAQAETRIWPATVKLVEAGNRGPIDAGIVAAVNEVLDADSRRLAVAFDRLPMVALYMLIFVSCGSMAVAGYNRGLEGDINRTRMTVVAAVLATVITVITDFDRPYSGFVLESQQPLIDVLREMDKALEADNRHAGPAGRP